MVTDNSTIPNNTNAGAEEMARRTQLPRLHGEAFITAWYRAMKGAIYYEPTNVIFTNLLRRCMSAVESDIGGSGAFTVKIIHDTCFLNNVRVHPGTDDFADYKAFVQLMHRLWIGEIEVHSDVTEADMAGFIFLLRDLEPNNENNYLLVKKELAARGLKGIDVGKLDKHPGDLNYIDSEALKHRSKEVYFTSINLVKELMDDAHNQKLLNVRKAKRLMLNAVNIIARDESTLLGLANIKDYDDYTFNHSVNVAIYAIALGQRLGISKRQLNYLGMAGLFHDIGKTNIEKEVLNKPGQLTPEEWEVIKRHPVLGAEIVLHLRGWGELSARMMTAAFEHHRKYDLSGYPPSQHPRRPTLFSRIITLADCYDAIGRPRVYRRTSFLPHQIMKILLEQSGKDFDPLLVKVFIGMIGVYPLGSLVALDTGEMGLVTQAPEDAAHIDRPKICLLIRDGARYRKDQLVDLTETGPDGEYTRTIVKPLDPAEFGIAIEEYFI